MAVEQSLAEFPSAGQAELAEEAYAGIKTAIIECLLAPGVEVSQTMLESRFGFGKAAIRTALTRLQQEGLVAAIPRRGYVVSSVTIRAIEDLYTLRLMIEPAAARLATPNLVEADFAVMAENMDIGYIPGDLDSQRKFVRANRAFHAAIVGKCGNARLTKVLDQIMEESARVFFLIMGTQDLAHAWCTGHVEIYEALRARDGERAAELLRRETDDGLTDVARAVMRSPAIAGLNVPPITAVSQQLPVSEALRKMPL